MKGNENEELVKDLISYISRQFGIPEDRVKEMLLEGLRKELEKPLEDLRKKYAAARRCIEDDVSVVDLLPWSRQLIDTMNVWLSFHRATILGELVRKLPEHMRPRALTTMLSARFEISQFTYVSQPCMDLISDFVSTAARIVMDSARRHGINRYVVGAARIIAIVTRSSTRSGFFIDRRSLLGLLQELFVNVSALL